MGLSDISLTLLQVPSFSDVPLHECDRVRVGAPCCWIQYLKIYNVVTSYQIGYFPSVCRFRHGCQFFLSLTHSRGDKASARPVVSKNMRLPMP